MNQTQRLIDSIRDAPHDALSSLACSLSRLSSRSGSSTVCATRSAAYYTRLLSPAWDSFLCRAYLAPSSSCGSAPAEIPFKLPS